MKRHMPNEASADEHDLFRDREPKRAQHHEQTNRAVDEPRRVSILGKKLRNEVFHVTLESSGGVCFRQARTRQDKTLGEILTEVSTNEIYLRRTDLISTVSAGTSPMPLLFVVETARILSTMSMPLVT